MVSKPKTAVPQRFLTKFPAQTNRENILRIRQFLGGIRECNLRRGKRGVGGGPFLKCKLTSTSARCSYRWASIRYFQLCKGIERRNWQNNEPMARQCRTLSISSLRTNFGRSVAREAPNRSHEMPLDDCLYALRIWHGLPCIAVCSATASRNCLVEGEASANGSSKSIQSALSIAKCRTA